MYLEIISILYVYMDPNDRVLSSPLCGHRYLLLLDLPVNPRFNSLY